MPAESTHSSEPRNLKAAAAVAARVFADVTIPPLAASQIGRVSPSRTLAQRPY
jgi:hypothetical protein